MEKTVINQGVLEVVNEMDNVAKIAAYRSLVHSAEARCIGAIRQDIRNRNRTVREEEEQDATGLDQRNEHDVTEHVDEEVMKEFGFEEAVPPIQLASKYHDLYAFVKDELETLTSSKWDAPLTPESMIDFMIKNTGNADTVMVKAIADAIHISEDVIKKTQEAQALRDKEALKQDAPEILSTFHGFNDHADETAWDALPVISQHQLGIKLIESLNKARDQVISRVVRTKKLTDLASVPLLEDAAKKVHDWVNDFEGEHTQEIKDVIDSGRSIRTLEDLK